MRLQATDDLGLSDSNRSVVAQQIMSAQPHAIYYAFTDSLIGGSAAAVVRSEGLLTPSQMQNMAKGFELPATCFIESVNQEEVHVRFFSTMVEYPMCGHGTLCVFSWLVEHGEINMQADRWRRFELHTPTAVKPVDIRLDQNQRLIVLLHLDIPETVTPNIDVSELATALGIGEDSVANNLPLEMSKAEFSHLIVPIKTLAAMHAMTPDFEALTRLSGELCVDTIMPFSLQTVSQDHSVHCRDFCPAVGTNEAAATGTTVRALCCYLQGNGLLAQTDGLHTIMAEQGYEMNKPSLVVSELSVVNGHIQQIKVGGVATRF